MNNQASAITDYNDYIADEWDEEAKAVELVSKTCGSNVAAERARKHMTQTDLAKAIGEKTSVVIGIENGTGPYVAGQISAIEKALNCRINRARKK